MNRVYSQFLVLAASIVTPAMADEVPLFDGHIYYSVGSPERYPPEEVIRILDAAGIDRALVSSTPNDGTRILYEKYPQRFIPELRPYRNTRDFETWAIERASWHRDPETVTFIERELERGIYRGIGEFHADGDEAATPVMREIAQLAESKGLWLHAHSDAAAVEHLFSHAPTLTIIWAHAGMSTPPAEIGRMLERYPRLFAELSYRYEVASDGGGAIRSGANYSFGFRTDLFMEQTPGFRCAGRRRSRLRKPLVAGYRTYRPKSPRISHIAMPSGFLID